MTSPRRTKKILYRTGVTLFALLVVFVLALILAMNTIATPQRITPILLNLSKQYIKSDVKCEAIDITLFGTFPNLGVKLQKGNISTATDTLLEFDHFLIALNPMAFLFEKKIIINQFELENAEIYAHVDTLGRANWDIFISTPDSVDTPKDTAVFVMPELNISNIRLKNVNLTYDDLQQDVLVMVDSLNMRFKGNLSKEQADLSLGIRTSGITSYLQGRHFTEALPVAFNTKLIRNRIQKTLAIERGRLSVGTLELKTNGILKQDTLTKTADVDIDFSLNASSLAELVGMIPQHVSNISTKLVAGGQVESSGKLTGTWGKEQYPVITLSAKLIDGTLASAKQPHKPFLEDFDLDFSTLIDLSGAQPSSLELNNLYLQTASSKLSAKGEFDHILTKPTIKAQANADINFTQLAQKLPFEGMKMEGQINADISLECLLNDILTSNFGKIDANGTMNVRNVKFNHAAEQFTFFTSNANVVLGTYLKEDSISRKIDQKLLRSKIVLDTLNFNWKEELIANSSRVSAQISTTPPKDTTSIAPISVGSRINNFRLVMGDSVRMRGVQAIGGIRVQPQEKNSKLPKISMGLSLDTLMGRAYDLSGRISKANLNLTFVKQPTRQRNVLTAISRDSTQRFAGRNIAGRDSTLTRAQRDSLRKSRLDPTTNMAFQIESQETRQLLRQWEVSGGLTSKEMSLRTPYFPLPLRMREAEMSFTSNTLSLKKAHLQFGKSDVNLSGEVDGIQRALLMNDKVSAKMTLDADSLDFNELIRAAIAGSEYIAKGTAEKDSISLAILDESQDIVLTEDTTALGIFVVPRNLDIEFNSRIKNAKFSDITIKNARGRIILRDQAIHLPRLTLNTDIGSAFMTMVYKAPNMKGAHLGMELNVKRIDLKELIAAFPIVNELAPMLQSFEGVVDCDMTAVTELDSLMNIRLPETTMSCFMSGQQLVLLDGESFAEISKMLMFKNKNRNVIDSMSVEMILEDEKLMIFPFQLSMDRYKAAVGGIQNLDMSFDYHITVLKSPVPFKLGLNISGTPEKMKIRMGKAKYKDLFTVAREKQLNNTTINLRKEMDEKLRQSIQDIAGMKLTQPLRRPRIALPDSLKRNLFQLEDSNEPIMTGPAATDSISAPVKIT